MAVVIVQEPEDAAVGQAQPPQERQGQVIERVHAFVEHERNGTGQQEQAGGAATEPPRDEHGNRRHAGEEQQHG